MIVTKAIINNKNKQPYNKSAILKISFFGKSTTNINIDNAEFNQNRSIT